MTTNAPTPKQDIGFTLISLASAEPSVSVQSSTVRTYSVDKNVMSIRFAIYCAEAAELV